MSNTPRVWVGSLAAYSAGSLIGDWFDAIDAPTDAREWVDAMAERGVMPTWQPEEARERMALEHEEIWVFDHEGFDGLLTGECSPTTARELAEALSEIGNDERPAFAVFCSNEGETPNAENMAELVERFRDAFCGYWDREADYAEDLAEEIGFPDDAKAGWPYTCIDWDYAWRELSMGGDNWSEYISGHGYAIFRSY